MAASSVFKSIPGAAEEDLICHFLGFWEFLTWNLNAKTLGFKKEVGGDMEIGIGFGANASL